MTTMDTQADQADQAGSGKFAPSREVTYDLIICHNDAIVFHDHYGSPALRLRMLAQMLTACGASEVVLGPVNTDRANQVRELHQSRSSQWGSAPDVVADAIAELCRRWGVQVYLSSTKKAIAAPSVLYSVITEYGPGQTVAEHFATREARRAYLVERAEMFFDAPDHIPERVLGDDRRLAALVATFLMPAAVVLAESALDEAGGFYKPAGRLLPIQ